MAKEISVDISRVGTEAGETEIAGLLAGNVRFGAWPYGVVVLTVTYSSGEVISSPQVDPSVGCDVGITRHPVRRDPYRR